MTNQKMTNPKIQIILGSTREGRIGEHVGTWFHDVAKAQREFDFEYIDLKDWPLPFFGTGDESLATTWQKKLNEADGYIIITTEYNHSFPAVLKNALDYGGKSFRNKPVAFVGYAAGEVGASRAIEHLRLVAVELQMAPIREAVHISNLYSFDAAAIDTPQLRARLVRFFKQLHWWTRTLSDGRKNHAIE